MGFLDALKGLFGGEDKAEQATETKEAEPSDDQISVEPLDTVEDNTVNDTEASETDKGE